jgi:hypothetical protein
MRNACVGLLGGLLLLATIACVPSGLSEAELADVGLRVEAVTEPDASVSRSEALASARKEYDPPGTAERVDAFLYRVTDPATLRSDRPIDRKPVWIVRYTNVSVQSPGGIPLTRYYSLIDATSGEWIGGHWRQ